jgi:hypothetical protein
MSAVGGVNTPKDESVRQRAPSEVATMQRSIAFKIIRGIFYRAAWILLYVLYLALVVIAFTMFFGVALVAFDSGGGVSGRARRDVTVGQRCAM